MFIRFVMIHERDGRTDRHRITAYTALMHTHRAVKTRPAGAANSNQIKSNLIVSVACIARLQSSDD